MLVLIFLSQLFISQLFAYAPPGFHIVNTLAKRHTDITNTVFKHRIMFYKKSGDLWFSVNEGLRIDDSGSYHYKITDDRGTEIYKTTKRPYGKDSIDRSVVYDLLYNKNTDNIIEKFKSIGLLIKNQKELYARGSVDESTAESNKTPPAETIEPSVEPTAASIESSLPLPYVPEQRIAYSRFENRICVVLGFVPATENASANTQLWIEKDSLVPVRLTIPANVIKGEETSLEFKLSGFHQYKTVLYPKTVQIHRDGKLWAKVDTNDVLVGSTDKTFEKNTAERQDSIDSDLKELLDHYFTLVR